METRIPNGTIIIDNETKQELKIIDVIKQDNKWGYGVYLYRFEGYTDTGFSLYRKEFTIKELAILSTKVISGFPGVGKSYLFNNNKNLKVLDSDSSQFSWVKDENGNNTKVREPNFPQNYIKHIKDNIGKVDIILVSSHDIVREALKNHNINYTIVYPHKSLKLDYIVRYARRGSDDNFIKFIDKNWDEFIDDIESDLFPTKISLNDNEYLGDILIKAYCSYYGELCSVKETNADEYEGNPCCKCYNNKKILDL